MNGGATPGFSRRVAVTLGCPCGVGPEVAAHAVAHIRARHPDMCVVVAGSAQAYLRHRGSQGVRQVTLDEAAGLPAGEFLVDTTASGAGAPVPGHPDDAADACAAAALGAVLSWAQAGALGAVATGPVRKRCLDRIAGGPWGGHTELFHHALPQGPRPVMLFCAPGMRLALHTIHVPLAAVAGLCTRPALLECLAVLGTGLGVTLGLKRPLVHVLGLNPHAGEDGRLGREELEHIGPAVAHAAAAGAAVEGPFAADGYFAGYATRRPRPDAVLALYHDQGLAPFKLWEKRRGHQMTLGLSVPRTACDHGTAYDVAARGGGADARSMTAALGMAVKLARRRRRVGAGAV